MPETGKWRNKAVNLLKTSDSELARWLDPAPVAGILTRRDSSATPRTVKCGNKAVRLFEGKETDRRPAHPPAVGAKTEVLCGSDAEEWHLADVEPR
jgi:hypothetical protein